MCQTYALNWHYNFFSKKFHSIGNLIAVAGQFTMAPFVLPYISCMLSLHLKLLFGISAMNETKEMFYPFNDSL